MKRFGVKKANGVYAILFMLVSLLFMFGAFARFSLNTAKKEDAFKAPEQPKQQIINAAAERKKEQLSESPALNELEQDISGEGTLNLVLLGLDSDTAREKAGRGYRSDMIALLVLDLKAPSCTVLSIPRDTRALIDKLDKSGRKLGSQYNRINASLAYGGGPVQKGYENILKSLERLLFDGLKSDVSLNYYASLDMDGIPKFADAVGGVPLTLEYDIPGFGSKGENILLNGASAAAFVRLRHGITGGSDLGRITRQQAFIRSFASRVQELGGREAFLTLYGTLSKYVCTNLNIEQILSLGSALSKLSLKDAEFLTLPGRCKTIDGRSYYVPDKKKIKSIALGLWG